MAGDHICARQALRRWTRFSADHRVGADLRTVPLVKTTTTVRATDLEARAVPEGCCLPSISMLMQKARHDEARPACWQIEARRSSSHARQLPDRASCTGSSDRFDALFIAPQSDTLPPWHLSDLTNRSPRSNPSKGSGLPTTNRIY